MGRSGRAEVAFVLLILQAAAGVLGVVGMVVLMHSPVYAVAAVLGPVGQVVLAGFVVRERRWAWAVVVAVEGWQLYAVAANQAIGLLPQVDLTYTLTGLLTRLGLPVALVCLGIFGLAVSRGR